MIFKIDGVEFVATDARHLVAQMHLVTRAPAATPADHMSQVAERANLQTGGGVRTDSPENFVADLVDLGLIEKVTVS